jgi:hypothetical protein
LKPRRLGHCAGASPDPAIIAPARRAGAARRSAVGLAAVLSAVVSLVACGGGARETVVVRVGASAITHANLIRWMALVAPHHEPPDPPAYARCVARRRASTPEPVRSALKEECMQEYGELKERALDRLILAQWLIGEAADRRLRRAGATLKMRLSDRRRDMSAAGATSADIALEVRAELAARAILQALAQGEPAVTRERIARFYNEHIQRFEHPERRYFDIFELLPSRRAALRFMARVGPGRRFSSIALHESLAETTSARQERGREALANAIFAARPRAMSGPIPYDHRYSVFVVTRIVPRTRQPLARVAAEIERRLLEAQRRQTLIRFLVDWRAKWVRATDCRPRYVVRECSAYRGGSAPPLDPDVLSRFLQPPPVGGVDYY